MGFLDWFRSTVDIECDRIRALPPNEIHRWCWSPTGLPAHCRALMESLAAWRNAGWNVWWRHWEHNLMHWEVEWCVEAYPRDIETIYRALMTGW